MTTPLTDDFQDLQLAKNFWLSEFLFSDFYSPRNQERVLQSYLDDPEVFINAKGLADNLQVLRDYLGCAISVNIGYRPKWWEIKQGRSGNSQHVKGWAADIIAEDYTPRQVQDAIEHLIETGKMKEGGLGRYNSFTHYDLRGNKARWDFI